MNILGIENYPNRLDNLEDFLLDANLKKVKVYDLEPLPNLNKIDGIIVSGGPMSLTEIESDELSYLRDVVNYLKDVINYEMPTLGICLGHQLLALANDCKIKKSDQEEIGWSKVELNESGLENELFKGIDLPLSMFQYHVDEIFDLKDNMNLLGYSDGCTIQAYQIGNKSIWGIQFHPEINAIKTDEIFTARKNNLESKEYKVNDMIKKGYENFGNNNYKIFSNFLNAVGGKNGK